MARIDLELPQDIVKELEDLEDGAMFDKMVEAGAKHVIEKVRVNLHKSFDDTDGLESCLKLSKVYKTPTDDAVNCKVMITGYFVNKQGERVPAPLVAMAREYGTDSGEAKKPFLRRSFRSSEIEAVMEKVEEEYFEDKE